MAQIGVQTNQSMGRIPTRVEKWPISKSSFEELAQCWQAANVWLSAWGPTGEVVATASDASSFWTSLWKEDNPFGSQLAVVAKSLLAGGDAATKEQFVPAETMGPWMPDIGVITIPVRRRRRIVGVILGCVLHTTEPGEGFSRLCDQCNLDRTAMLNRIRQGSVAAVSPERAVSFYELLKLGVRQAQELNVGHEEIDILTGNLENTYEELHLIYQISSRLTVSQKPIKMLERVAGDLLDVSRASAVAFVLNERESYDRGVVSSSPSLSDRVVQVGEGAPGLSDVVRLFESVEPNTKAGKQHILLNDAKSNSSLKWVDPWLDHVVVLPLWWNGELLGAMLAMNCDDTGDFTSVDVQLLRAVADRVEAALRNQYLYDDLAALLMGLLHSLVSSIDAKDPYTCGHSQRVAYISRALAQRAGFPEVECERVYLSGLLHDVGKLGVAEAILSKPGKLTNEEFDSLRKHPEIGMRILSQIRQVRDLVPGVLHHHERVDGRGYPHGLAGSDIPLLGRIVCLADCFDAMTTNRTYRAALPVDVAITEIRRCAGTQFDAHLAELFVTLDLPDVIKAARSSFSSDSTIGHVGALYAVVQASPASTMASAKTCLP